MKKLIAFIIVGQPTRAFGEHKDKDKDKDEDKDKGGVSTSVSDKPGNAADKDGPLDGSGPTLHGSPTVGPQKVKPRDETKLAQKALDVTTGVTEESGTDSEVAQLIARAHEIKDGNALPKRDIVELRSNLQRFRGISDEMAATIDQEINRLDAFLIGLDVKKGAAKAEVRGAKSITQQKRNLPSKY